MPRRPPSPRRARGLRFGSRQGVAGSCVARKPPLVRLSRGPRASHRGRSTTPRRSSRSGESAGALPDRRRLLDSCPCRRERRGRARRAAGPGREHAERSPALAGRVSTFARAELAEPAPATLCPHVRGDVRHHRRRAARAGWPRRDDDPRALRGRPRAGRGLARPRLPGRDRSRGGGAIALKVVRHDGCPPNRSRT